MVRAYLFSAVYNAYTWILDRGGDELAIRWSQRPVSLRGAALAFVLCRGKWALPVLGATGETKRCCVPAGKKMSRL